MVNIYFSEMIRAGLLITCLLLTIVGESLASSKRSSTNQYIQCFQQCLNDCEGPYVNQAVLNCGPDAKESYCQSVCDDYAITVPDEIIEDDEREYLSPELKKRELDELKKLIGVGS